LLRAVKTLLELHDYLQEIKTTETKSERGVPQESPEHESFI